MTAGQTLHEGLERVVLLELCRMSSGHQLPVALTELDVSDPDVADLKPVLG